MRRIVPILMALLLPVVAGAAMEAMVFDHDYHLEEYESDCGACHQEADLDIVPPSERCLECHEADFIEEVKIPARATHDSFWYQDHGKYVRELDANCVTCHQDEFCFDCHKAGFADEQGKLNIHRSDFSVTHPISARADNRSCTICHEKSFCVDCHSDFEPDDLAFESHRRSWSNIDTPGGSHAIFTTEQCEVCHSGSVLTSHEWTDSHAREARRSLPTCQACHPDADVCLKCHSAREGLIVNPHPADWDDMKEYLDGASGGKTCRRCH
jgi:hypothetical protein